MKNHGNTRDTYICPICNKSLNSRMTYRKHERIHYGKGYSCELCDKMFTRQDSLKYHNQVIHEKKQVSIDCIVHYHIIQVISKHI